MKFVDEFRDPAAARALVRSITELARDGEYKFMEVCGGHTHTIYRHGIEHLLPEQVELVHGPTRGDRRGAAIRTSSAFGWTRTAFQNTARDRNGSTSPDGAGPQRRVRI